MAYSAKQLKEDIVSTESIGHDEFYINVEHARSILSQLERADRVERAAKAAVQLYMHDLDYEHFALLALATALAEPT